MKTLEKICERCKMVYYEAQKPVEYNGCGCEPCLKNHPDYWIAVGGRGCPECSASLDRWFEENRGTYAEWEADRKLGGERGKR